MNVGHDPFAFAREITGVKMLYASSRKTPGIEMHEHGLTLISFAIRGAMREFDSHWQSTDTAPLTAFLTPPDYVHAHSMLSDSILSMCVGFENDFLRDAGAENLKERPLAVRSGPAISTLMRMQSEVLSNDSASSLILEGMALQLVGELSRSSGKKASHAPSWLRSACALLRQRCLDNISIEDVAREVGVSSSYLARMFREHLNQTPGDYLRQKRIEWAMRQVTSSDKKLQQIASEAGFADQAHFTRHFKQQVGLSPSEVRRSLVP